MGNIREALREASVPQDLIGHEDRWKYITQSRTGSTFKTEVETKKGAVVYMESTYYNVVAPASYGGWSKFKPKGYTKKKSENGYSLRTRTRCINQLDEDFPDVKWSCMELTTSGRRI